MSDSEAGAELSGDASPLRDVQDIQRQPSDIDQELGIVHDGENLFAYVSDSDGEAPAAGAFDISDIDSDDEDIHELEQLREQAQRAEAELAQQAAASVSNTPGTLDFYQEKLDETAWDRAPGTYREFLAGIYEITKNWGGTASRAMDDLLLYMNVWHGGRQHSGIPPSYHLFKKVMEVPELNRFEWLPQARLASLTA